VTLAVVDASALVEYLLRTPIGEALEPSILGADLHVPALCDVEVTAALRRGLLSGTLEAERAELALQDLADLPLTRHGHQLLLRRALSLRHNLSVYDATYAVLAERLGAALITADGGLAKAARSRLGLEVVEAAAESPPTP
jgi:predicted nucleic acid-binding protein